MARKVRVALVGVGVLALLGVHAPQPVHASTAGSVVFMWQIWVGTGNDAPASPCITGLPSTFFLGMISPSLCLILSTLTNDGVPHAVTVKPTPAAKHSADVMPNIQYDRAPTLMLFDSLICVTSDLNVDKPTKPTTESGLCATVGSGIVQGHCEFATGLFAGANANAHNMYGFDVKFTVIASKLLFSGHMGLGAGNPAQGWVRGVADVMVDGTTGSCTNKHQLRFIATGQATFLLLNPA